MITYEQKLSHTTNVVFSEFSELLGYLGCLVSLKLFWIENRKLKIRGTMPELIAMLDLDGTVNEDGLLRILRTIKECGLINAKKNEEGLVVISTNLVNKPDLEQKLAILENILAKGLATPPEGDIIRNSIISKNEKRKIREALPEPDVSKPKTSTDVDFDKPKAPRKVNPDSAPELVKFYYRLMHDVFGGRYESPNFLKEAHQLKLEMQKHGDSAEDTRKFFALILNGAKEKDAFDKVSSLSLYSRLRPAAYQKIIVEKNSKYDKFMKYEEVQKSDDDIMTSIGEIYELCVKNGTAMSEIKAQLVDAFTPELVDEFFKGLTND